MISYYELLKRIEKGDIPEKIKVHLTPRTSRIYTADYDGSDFSHYFIDGETNEDYKHYLAECFLESDMFDKNIEILEEEKKIPEKIKTKIGYGGLTYLEDEDFSDGTNGFNHREDVIVSKINEIIDYLNSKGE